MDNTPKIQPRHALIQGRPCMHIRRNLFSSLPVIVLNQSVFPSLFKKLGNIVDQIFLYSPNLNWLSSQTKRKINTDLTWFPLLSIFLFSCLTLTAFFFFVQLFTSTQTSHNLMLHLESIVWYSFSQNAVWKASQTTRVEFVHRFFLWELIFAFFKPRKMHNLVYQEHDSKSLTTSRKYLRHEKTRVCFAAAHCAHILPEHEGRSAPKCVRKLETKCQWVKQVVSLLYLDVSIYGGELVCWHRAVCFTRGRGQNHQHWTMNLTFQVSPRKGLDFWRQCSLYTISDCRKWPGLRGDPVLCPMTYPPRQKFSCRRNQWGVPMACARLTVLLHRSGSVNASSEKVQLSFAREQDSLFSRFW